MPLVRPRALDHVRLPLAGWLEYLFALSRAVNSALLRSANHPEKQEFRKKLESACNASMFRCDLCLGTLSTFVRFAAGASPPDTSILVGDRPLRSDDPCEERLDHGRHPH